MKFLYRAGAVVCLLLAAVCVMKLLPSMRKNTLDDYVPDLPKQEMQTPTAETPKPQEPTQTEEPKEPYVSPIDFEMLQTVNPDIYAWLDIPVMETSYPLVQHSTDDSFYLNHGSDGQELAAGALFTEHIYNNKDFDDPVTIVYGHHYQSGIMFGKLQTFYSDPENFENNKAITIYLPDCELHYEVFAATRYDNRHILDNYNFRDERIYNLFFESILGIRDLGSNFDKNCVLTPDDKVLILSTCLQGDYSQRYLVFAKQIEKI